MSKVLKTFWWSMTIVAGIFGIVWTWSAAPAWWPTALSLAAMIVTFICGKAWKAPEAP